MAARSRNAAALEKPIGALACAARQRKPLARRVSRECGVVPPPARRALLRTDRAARASLLAVLAARAPVRPRKRGLPKE